SRAPPSGQAAVRATLVVRKRRSVFHLPMFGLACQGRMRRLTATFLIFFAEDLAFSYLRSEKGAISPGRWHSTHRFWRIGSTSLWNVSLEELVFPEGSAGLPIFSTAHPGASVAATGGAFPASSASIASTR